jgi:hypothetical protein
MTIFEEIVQPSVLIFGIRISEPVTSLTDIMASAACFYFAYSIYQFRTERNQLFYLAFLYFLLMGAATFFGGVLGHAFQHRLTLPWKLPGWITSMVSVMCLERFVIFRLKKNFSPAFFRILNILNIVEFLLLTSLTIYTLNFFIVEAHGTYGILFVVGGLELWNYLKTKGATSLLMLRAVSMAIVTALIHLTRFSIDEWFNYADIAHVLMIFTAYFFYRAVRKKLTPGKNPKDKDLHSTNHLVTDAIDFQHH